MPLGRHNNNKVDNPTPECRCRTPNRALVAGSPKGARPRVVVRVLSAEMTERPPSPRAVPLREPATAPWRSRLDLGKPGGPGMPLTQLRFAPDNPLGAAEAQ
jgi:hypothetical protein